MEPGVRFGPSSWLRSTLGWERDPNQATPQADASVFGHEIARCVPLELQPRHHRLRSKIIGARVGHDLLDPRTPGCVLQRGLRAFSRVAVAPGCPDEPPANLEVRPEWTIRKEAWHDP